MDISPKCLIYTLVVVGPLGQKSSSEAMIILIAGCSALLYGRGIGYWLHNTSPDEVPPYHVSLVLIANGLAILLCTTDDFAKMILYYGIFGFLFGKLKKNKKKYQFAHYD